MNRSPPLVMSDKADPIDDDNLDELINELNKSIQEQEELQGRLSRAEWSPINKDQIEKLGQWIAFNEKKQGIYVMRASKTILSILHRGFNKIKQDGKVMVLDQQSAEKLYNRLRLVETDECTFENESGTYKDILSPGNRWLEPNTYLRIFGKKFVKDMGFDVDRPRTGTNNKKRSHTQLDSRKQVIAFQDRVITINIKEAQHPLK